MVIKDWVEWDSDRSVTMAPNVNTTVFGIPQSIGKNDAVLGSQNLSFARKLGW